MKINTVVTSLDGLVASLGKELVPAVSDNRRRLAILLLAVDVVEGEEEMQQPHEGKGHDDFDLVVEEGFLLVVRHGRGDVVGEEVGGG